MSQESLSVQEILQNDDQTIEWVPTPEWGGEGKGVWVASMTGEERGAWNRDDIKDNTPAPGQKEKELNPNFLARYIVRCLVNNPQNRERLFTKEQAGLLGKKNGAVLLRIYNACLRVNGMGEEEAKALGKPSTTTPNSTSGTASPSPGDARSEKPSDAATATNSAAG